MQNGWRAGYWSLALILFGYPYLTMDELWGLSGSASDLLIRSMLMVTIGLGSEFLLRQPIGKAHRSAVMLAIIASPLTMLLVLGTRDASRHALFIYILVFTAVCVSAIRPRPLALAKVAFAMTLFHLLLVCVSTFGNREDVLVAGSFSLLWLMIAGLFAMADDRAWNTVD